MSPQTPSRGRPRWPQLTEPWSGDHVPSCVCPAFHHLRKGLSVTISPADPAEVNTTPTPPGCKLDAKMLWSLQQVCCSRMAVSGTYSRPNSDFNNERPQEHDEMITLVFLCLSNNSEITLPGHNIYISERCSKY